MATFTFILLAVSLLVATSAAPKNTKFDITIPEECKGKRFCSVRPKEYDDIEKTIEELLPLHNRNDIDNRSGYQPLEPQSEDDDNCPSVTSPETLYIVQEDANTKAIIVQTKYFPQILTITNCKHSKKVQDGNAQCFTKLGVNSFHMKSSCQQSYAERSLLVYDPAKNITLLKTYPIPVCCSCQITTL